jgi:hypothetical protein
LLFAVTISRHTNLAFSASLEMPERRDPTHTRRADSNCFMPFVGANHKIKHAFRRIFPSPGVWTDHHPNRLCCGSSGKEIFNQPTTDAAAMPFDAPTKR